MNKRELLDKIKMRVNDDELISELHRHLDVPEERDIVKNEDGNVVIDFTQMPYQYDGYWVEDENGEWHEELAFIDKEKEVKRKNEE